MTFSFDINCNSNENLKEFCNERKSHNLLYNKYGQCNTTGMGLKKKYNKNLVNIKGTPKIDNILYGTNMVEVSI